MKGNERLYEKNVIEWFSKNQKALIYPENIPVTVFRLLNLKDFSSGREEAYESPYDTEEGHYKSYRDRNLPEGPYRQSCNVDEYDRYAYDHGESPVNDMLKDEPCERLKSYCNDIGRLVF